MADGFLRATLTLLAGGALAQAIPLVLGPWLARLYTPEVWGQFSTFMALATNVAVVACGRFEFALPLAKNDEEAQGLLALSAKLLAATTLLTLALGLCLWGSSMGPWALVLPLAVCAMAGAQALTLWATRAQRFRALAAARLVQYGGAAVIQVGWGLLGLGVMGLVAGPIMAAALACVWLCWPVPARGWGALWHTPWHASWELARRYKEFPLLNTPHAFAGALQDTLAVALLMAWSGDAAVGFWGLALRYLKAPATLIGGAVSQVLYPKLTQAEPEQARRLVRHTMMTLLLLAAPMVGLVMVWGPDLFAWAFGDRWREAGQLAVALAPYIGAHFVASPLAVVTLAWQAQGWALKFALLGQGIFLVSMAVGLWWGGWITAAWCISAGMVVYFGLYFFALARWKSIPPAQSRRVG
jgi:O-antigen/teichoic acid export membrane protein